MYTKITNPLTKRNVNINSKLGKQVLQKYISSLKGGCNLDRLLRHDIKKRIYGCRANQKKNTRSETLFCKLHNIQEGFGLRRLFSEINISNIVTPELQKKIEQLFIDIHNTGYIQKFFGGTSPLPLTEITLKKGNKKGIILKRNINGDINLDTFNIMIEDEEQLNNYFISYH